MAFFDEGAAGMTGDPAEVVAFQIPRLQLFDDPLRMVLGNIVQVVGHRAANEQRGVVLQGFQNRNSGRGVENQRR